MTSHNSNAPCPKAGQPQAKPTTAELKQDATDRVYSKAFMQRRFYTSEAEFLSKRCTSGVSARSWDVAIAGLPGSRQYDRFHPGSLYSTNVLLYIIPSADDVISEGPTSTWIASQRSRRSVRAAVADAFFQRDPKLLLDQRFYFHECLPREIGCAQCDLHEHLEKLIADHRALCDRLPSLKEEHDARPGNQPVPGYTPLPNERMVMPMLRSVFLLVWPSKLDENGWAGVDNVSLVLTGDDAGMKSGPLHFDTFSRAGTGDDRVANVSLGGAVDFLTAVDEREVAANSVLRSRNEACAERIRRSWETSGIDSTDSAVLQPPRSQVDYWSRRSVSPYQVKCPLSGNRGSEVAVHQGIYTYNRS